MKLKIEKVKDNGLRYWSELTAKADYIASYDDDGDYTELYRKGDFLVVRNKEVKVFIVLELSYDYEKNTGEIALEPASKEKIRQLISEIELDIKAERMRVEKYDRMWERGKPIEKVREEVQVEVQRLKGLIADLKKLL